MYLLRSDGAYDHAAVAEDEHAALAAGASQRHPDTNKVDPVTAVPAARWDLKAITPLHPNAIQRVSGLRCANIEAESANAPDDQKPSREALERLMHTGLVPAPSRRARTPRP